MTGILRISKESIFSGVNNVSVFTVLDSNCSSYFGFLEHEVKELLKQHDLEEYLPNVQSWYNGYCFGNKTVGVYNPWSILKWLVEEDHTFKPYWVNTAKNDIIRTLYLENHHSLKPEFFSLFLGETIETLVNTETTFDAHLTQNADIFWGFILQTGYLTVAKKEWRDEKFYHTLKIPNKEVRIVFENMVNDWLATLVKDLKKPELPETIAKSLVQEDLELFHETLQEIILQTMSYHDFNRNIENAFHAFMAGLMVWLSGIYEVKSNRESGEGRFDLCLIPKKHDFQAYIFEFKAIIYIKKKEILEEKVQKELELALNQIDNQLYDTELKAKGVNQMTKVALVFYGKKVWMKYK